eukprot:1186772-Prorocentrum_minimum.AAC.1
MSADAAGQAKRGATLSVAQMKAMLLSAAKTEQVENHSQEGRQYIPSVRTYRRRGDSIYPAGCSTHRSNK